jgi:hypothetical protein
MAVLKNRAGVGTSTTGTGTITLGAALTAAQNPNAASWQTFGTAGVASGDTVRYLILDSNGAWEYGPGTYSSAGVSLTRAAGALDGSIAGQKSSTGALLVLSGTAQVFIAAVAEDLVPVTSDTAPVGPANGQLWWESDTGTLWMFYNDGNTSQWVSVSGGGGSGNVLSSGTPTNGQLAAWTGANTVQGVAPATVGASKVLLLTITPSGTNTIIIPSSVLTSAYDAYEIELHLDAVAAVGAVWMRVSTDGGSTFQSGASSYHTAYNYAASNNSGASQGNADTKIAMGFGPNVGFPATGTIKVYRPYLNTFKNFHFNMASFGSGIFFSTIGAGSWLSASSPINALQLFWSTSENFGANSLVKVYGIR